MRQDDECGLTIHVCRGGDMGPGKTQGESAGGVLQRLEVGSGHFQHFRSALLPFFVPKRADRNRSGDIRERWAALVLS